MILGDRTFDGQRSAFFPSQAVPQRLLPQAWKCHSDSLCLEFAPLRVMVMHSENITHPSSGKITIALLEGNPLPCRVLTVNVISLIHLNSWNYLYYFCFWVTHIFQEVSYRYLHIPPRIQPLSPAPLRGILTQVFTLSLPYVMPIFPLRPFPSLTSIVSSQDGQACELLALINHVHYESTAISNWLFTIWP